jgi:hypothetical protein
MLRVSGIVAAALLLAARGVTAQTNRFEIDVSPTIQSGPVTGRLVLVVSKSAQAEPRLLIGPQGPAMFAVDIEQLAPGQRAVIDQTSLGYPGPLATLPAGEYTVQAVINVYDQIRRADGHMVWLPMNDGTQEFFSNAAGNLYSVPQKVRIGDGASIRLTVSKSVPPATRPADTQWVKYVTIESKKLSQFWGRPIFIHATVLLPKGYNAHAAAKYPTVFTFGHNVPFSFTTDSTRVRGRGTINATTGLETGYDFHQAWIADGLPRFIAVSFEQQTPFFPDSYSLNSANSGPYGDAMIEEVIPYLEQRFRMIAKPYARLVEGASTGGWQSLSLQLKYPDYFGGAWVLQPDPIDFRRYQLVDIYSDTNAFVIQNSQFSVTERPFRRSVEGQEIWSVRQLSLFEEVLGTRGRSGYQLGAWEALYGPMGADGYPKPLWNKLTGSIDKSVAAYWRDNGYDLREYAQRNWTTLGPKLAGKLHFFAGDMDDFYLNLAVYRFEEFAKSATNPASDAEFTYGRPMKGHSWHAFPWAELVRRMGAHVKSRTPAGDDPRVWNY